MFFLKRFALKRIIVELFLISVTGTHSFAVVSSVKVVRISITASVREYFTCIDVYVVMPSDEKRSAKAMIYRQATDMVFHR